MSDTESNSDSRTDDKCRLGSKNYLEWAMRMKAKLIRKDLWSVVQPGGDDTAEETPVAASGTTSDATAEGTTVPAVKPKKDMRSKKKMEQARALMIDYVTKSQLSHMRDEDPRVIWINIRRHHRAYGLATEIGLKRKFLTSQKKPSQSMQDWITTISEIRWELEESGVTINDKDVILALTMGLGFNYEAFVVSLDATPADQLTMEYVIHRLLNEESRRVDRDSGTGRDEVKQESALKTGPRLCWICGKPGHFKAECPENKDDDAKKKEAEKRTEKANVATTDPYYGKNLAL